MNANGDSRGRGCHRRRLRKLVPVGSLAAVLVVTALAGPSQATFRGKNGRIVYAAQAGRFEQLFTVRPDGSARRQITRFTDSAGGSLSHWSPDGTRIVFTRRTCPPGATYEATRGEELRDRGHSAALGRDTETKARTEMQNRLTTAIPVTALLVLALSACGGDEQPSGAAATTAAAQEPATTAPAAGEGGGEVDACALLGDEEIAAATTHAVQSEQAGRVQGIFANGCEWQLADDAGVSVGVISPGGRSYYEKFFEPFIGDGVTGPEERVEGIADKAARFDTGDIMAVEGDTLVNVSYLKPQAADENSEGVTEKLIVAALSNLP